MITRKGIAFAAMLLTVTVSSPLMAQRRNADAAGQRGQRGGAPQAPLNYNPKPGSPEEGAAFQAIQNEPGQGNRVTLSDTFLTTYPNSQLAGYVQRFRMEAFTRLGKYKEAVAAGEQGLALETKYLEGMLAKADAEELAAKNAPKVDPKKVDKNAPPPPVPMDKNSEPFKALIDQTEKALLYYYQNLMSGSQALNDAPKTIEWAQKALGQQPDDLLTLLTLSSVMAARPSTDAKVMEGQMKEAEEHSKKAIGLVNTLLAGPMGAQIPPADKANLLSSSHQTLGRVYYNQKKYAESQREFGASLVAKKDDGDTHLFMGLALAQDKPPKVDDAMESLAKAVFLKGPSSAQANDVLKQMYMNVKKSMDGYDAFIAAAGAKLQ